MVALSHIVLHVGLCRAVARLSPQTTVAMRVLVTDKVRRTQFDQIVQFQRGTRNDTPVEYDSSFGTYRVDLSIPKYRCNATDYFEVIPEHNRVLNITLGGGPPNVNAPVLVMGSLPQSFSYVQPTVVLFPASVPCKGDASNPITVNADTQIEEDAYYATLRDPALFRYPVRETVALQLTDSTGGYHFVRIPWKFVSGYSWPTVMSVNIDDGFVDYVAGEPEDTLLCPKGYVTETS